MNTAQTADFSIEKKLWIDRVARTKIGRIVTNPLYCASLYLCFFLVAQIQVVRQFLGYTQYIFVLWSFILIAYQLLCERWVYRVRGLWFLVALLVSGLITFAFRFSVFPTRQIKSWILLLIAITLIYPLGRYIASQKNPHRSLAIVLLPSLIITFFQGIASIVMLAGDVSYLGPYHGDVLHLGVVVLHYNSNSPSTILFGLNQDSNHAALYALISIFITLWAFRYRSQIFSSVRARDIYQRIFWINLIVQFFSFVAYNSRGSMVALYIAIIFSLPFLLYGISTRYRFSRSKEAKLLCSSDEGRQQDKNEALVSVSAPNKKHHKKLLRGVVITFICLLIAIEGLHVVVQSSVAQYIDTIQTLLPHQGKDEQQEKEVAFSKGNPEESARVIIWTETLELWTHHPIVGVGPYNTQYFAKKAHITSSDNYLQRGTVPHNSYLDVLVAYGILGFLCYVGFFIFYIISLTKRMRHTDIDFEDGVFLVTALIIMVGVLFLTESYLGLDYMFAVLLILLSYLVSKKYITHVPYVLIKWVMPDKQAASRRVSSKG